MDLNHSPPGPRLGLITGGLLLGVGVGLRLLHVGHGLPEFTEEAFIFRRALEMWGAMGTSIDWNPRDFVYPSLTYYLHLALQHAVYWLSHRGRPADFLLDQLTNPTGAVVTARCLSIAADGVSVIMAWKIGARFGMLAAASAGAIVALSPTLIATSRLIYADSVMTALLMVALERLTPPGSIGLRRWAAAALFTGLAVGAKYSAIVLLLPAAVVLTSQPRSRWWIWGCIYTAIVAGVFAVTSPFVVFSPAHAIRDLTFVTQLARGGLGVLERSGLQEVMRLLWANLGLLGLLAGLTLFRRGGTRTGTRNVIALWTALAGVGIPTALVHIEAERYVCVVVATAAPIVGAGLAILVTLLRRSKPGLALGFVILGAAGLSLLAASLRAAGAGAESTEALAGRWCSANMRPNELLLAEAYGPSTRTVAQREQVLASPLFAAATPRAREVYLAKQPVRLISLPLVVSGYDDSMHTDNGPARPILPHVVEWNRAVYVTQLLRGVSYVAVSDAVRGRFMRDAERFPEMVEFYAWLDREASVVARFVATLGRLGPTITIYSLEGRGETLVNAAPQLDSLWWCRPVPARNRYVPGAGGQTGGGHVRPELARVYRRRFERFVNDLASNALAAGRYRAAIPLLRAHLVALPGDSWGVGALTFAAVRAEEWEVLVAALRGAIAEGERSGTVDPRLRLTLADALIASARESEARALLRELVMDVNPDVRIAARDRLRETAQSRY